MIRDDGYVKVLDFGLAKLTRAVPADENAETQPEFFSRPGMIMGTSGYLSPEQARAKLIDSRSDIFSFGVVLYEMLVGWAPFTGETAADMTAAIVQTDPSPPSRINGNVPAELDRVVLKMLEKDRAERYQSAADLLVDLKHVQKQTEIAVSRSDQKTIQMPASATGTIAARKSAEDERKFAKRNYAIAAIAAFAAVLLIAAVGAGYWFLFVRSTSQIDSIAVMPFVNESGNLDIEYLSDGMTDTLINSLSQLPNLGVRARSSVFRYKGKDIDAQAIGKELGVQAVLNGRVVQRGEGLTLYLELIDAQTGNRIWGDRYIRKQTDLISLQNEIARDVADKLKVKLTGADEQKLAKNYTENPEAYRLFLKGRYQMLKLTPAEMRKSIEFFRQAIDADPTYASAYVGLADAHRLLAITGEMPPNEAFPKAKAALSRALEIDVTHAEAHSSSGSVKFWFDWDWSGSEAEFRRALELAPNNVQARPSYAHFLSNMGRFDEAIAEIKKAREHDPLSLTANSLEGLFLFYAGRDDEAIARLQKTIEIEPKFWLAHINLAKIYIRQERFDEAIRELNIVKELSAGNSEAVSLTGYTLAISGERTQAEAAIDELRKMSAQKYVPSYHIALICNGLDRRDETFDWLEMAFANRDVYLSFIKVDPKWDKFRSDSRFVSLLNRMNLQ